jgi:hypothetical protein
MSRKYSVIIEAAKKVLSEYTFPLTVRQIYYRLVANGTIPNTRSSYNGFDKWLVKARECGDIDDTKIEDRTRSIITWGEVYDSPEDFIRNAEYWFRNLGSNYQADLWASQDVYVECWVEKDALSQVIARPARQFAVTVCPAKGYGSYTYIKRDGVDKRLSEISQ